MEISLKNNSLIYKPKGKSLEYAGEDAYALNVYEKCDYGCTYCYNQRKDKNFFSGNTLTKEERLLFLRKLEKEIPNYAWKKIFLSFGSDPFPPIEATYDLTAAVLSLFHKYNITPIILTKGIVPTTSEFLLRSIAGSIYPPNFEKHPVSFGTTLVSRSETEFEPFAASYDNRVLQLQKFHSFVGVKNRVLKFETWVSLEPVIDPKETLKIIEETHEYVDHYKVGMWNYDERSKNIDWADFGKRAIELLEKLNKKYIIKKELLEKINQTND
jgi:DNA repair photolyase